MYLELIHIRHCKTYREGIIIIRYALSSSLIPGKKGFAIHNIMLISIHIFMFRVLFQSCFHLEVHNQDRLCSRFVDHFRFPSDGYPVGWWEYLWENLNGLPRMSLVLRNSYLELVQSLLYYMDWWQIQYRVYVQFQYDLMMTIYIIYHV